MRMALWMGLSKWVSMSCLCVVRWMALTSVASEGLSSCDERRAQGVLAGCNHVLGEVSAFLVPPG